MKKVPAVFAILMVTVSLYAVINSNSAFTASLKLVPIIPQYNIYAGLDAVSYTAMGAANIAPFNPESPATYDLVCESDISSDDITVYIKVLQFGKAHYSTSVNTPFDLTVTATELRMDGTSDVYKTEIPSVVDGSVWDDVYLDVDLDLEGRYDFISRNISIDGSEVTYRIEYPTGIMVPAVVRQEPVAVGGFAYRWLSDEDLLPGTYHAYIRMEYTVI